VDNLILPIAGLLLVGLLYGVLTRSGGGIDRNLKLAALVVVGLLPALWLAAALQYAEGTMKKVDFCIQCHSMQKYGDSLHVDDDEPLSADHFQNNRISREKACYECHTDYVAFGGVKSKLRGLRHVYAHYAGAHPEDEELELYSPYPNSNCLRCHDGAVKYEKHKKHRLPAGRLEKIRSGERSCLTECHDVAHYFGDDEEEDEDEE
jgi:nitrate/TMAO reductase-like tetraheme cytochrome c subunit